MTILTGKVISCRKVNPILTTQEDIYRVEDIAKKNVIKSLLKLKYLKEVIICEDDDKNDDSNGSISVVEDDDED